jgi:hypothetical protein
MLRPVTIKNSLVEDLSKLIEMPIDELIEAFTGLDTANVEDVTQ